MDPQLSWDTFQLVLTPVCSLRSVLRCSPSTICANTMVGKRSLYIFESHALSFLGAARWFRKYNFLMSAALDGGTQVMVFVWS